jgi:hypothetical protein
MKKVLKKYPHNILQEEYTIYSPCIPANFTKSDMAIDQPCVITVNTVNGTTQLRNVSEIPLGHKNSKTIYDCKIFNYKKDNELIIEFTYFGVVYSHFSPIKKGRLLFRNNKVEIYLFNYDSKEWCRKIYIEPNLVSVFRRLPFDYLKHFDKFKKYFEKCTLYKLNSGVDYFKNNDLLNIFMLMDSLSKNPAMSLVYNAFPDYANDLVTKHHYEYTDALCTSGNLNDNLSNYNFDFTATNVKDFLRVNKTTYKWVIKNNFDLFLIKFLKPTTESWKELIQISSGAVLNRYGVPGYIERYYRMRESYRKLTLEFVNHIKNKYLKIKKIDNIIFDYMDYLVMCNKLNVAPKTKLSLNNFYKEHDLVSDQYQLLTRTSDDIKFSKINDSLNIKFSTTIDKYTFIFPSNVASLAREGKLQRHCVASYHDRVVDEESYIVFMRNSSDLNTPLVTVEVSTRFNRVLQARGFANRSITAKESQIIHEWLKYVNDVKNKK